MMHSAQPRVHLRWTESTFGGQGLREGGTGKRDENAIASKTNSGMITAGQPKLTIAVYGSWDINTSRAWYAQLKHKSTFGGQGLRAGGTGKRDENAIPRKPTRAW